MKFTRELVEAFKSHEILRKIIFTQFFVSSLIIKINLWTELYESIY